MCCLRNEPCLNLDVLLDLLILGGALALVSQHGGVCEGW